MTSFPIIDCVIIKKSGFKIILEVSEVVPRGFMCFDIQALRRNENTVDLEAGR
jgi:hypothetical protein